MEINNSSKTLYLVFDFDGTLADTWQATVKAHAVLDEKSEEETAENLLNTRLITPRYTKNRIYTEQETAELLEFRQKEYELKKQLKIKLFDGFVDAIKALENTKMAVVSTAFEPVLKQFCNQTGLEFTHVIGFGPNFSKQAKMEEIAQNWNINLGEIYFITDTIRDVVEAKEFLNPAKIIGCSWGFHGFNRLKEVLPESQILKNFDDLEKTITNLQAMPTIDPRSKFLEDLNGESAINDDSFFIKTYPAHTMSSASEIFNIWICRMIMLGYHFTDKPPFDNVFIHAVARDEKGRKMSKSLGNGIDPIEMIEKYSADSLRMALNSQIVPGRDIMLSKKSADELVVKWRNFGNKLWNISRFLYETEE